MFPALAGNENDKRPILETSASGQFTLSTFLIQPSYLVIPLNPFPSPKWQSSTELHFSKIYD